MERRTLLRGLSLGIAGGAGCVSATERGCPEVSIESELRHEVFDADRIFGTETGTVLLPGEASLDEFDGESLPSDARDWIEATDFDEAVVVGVQVGSSGSSSPLTIRGVERDDSDAVRVYTCIEEHGESGDWAPYAKLLRVFVTDWTPVSARLTHWTEDEKTTYGPVQASE